MQQILLVAALLCGTMAMPQQRAPVSSPAAVGNPNVRILQFESFQDGANFGHQLFQEDGTTSGQKIGPDGLIYGFYSYLQPDGSRVKVYWRAGQGIGYEVLGVEGLIEENLGNLKATISRTTEGPIAPKPPKKPTSVFVPTAPNPKPINHVEVPSSPKLPAQLHANAPIPVVPEIAVVPEIPEPLSRFDYPATLNLERTATGFFSSLTATR